MGDLLQTVVLALTADEFLRAYYSIIVMAILFGSISLASSIFLDLKALEPRDFSAPNTGNKTTDCEKVKKQLADARQYKKEKSREARRNALVVAVLGVVVPTAVLVISVLLLPWLLGEPGIVYTVGENVGKPVTAPSAQAVFSLFVQSLVTEDGVSFIRLLLRTPEAFRVGFDTSNFVVFLILLVQKIWVIAFLKDLAIEVAPKIVKFSTDQSEREKKLMSKLDDLECELGGT